MCITERDLSMPRFMIQILRETNSVKALLYDTLSHLKEDKEYFIAQSYDSLLQDFTSLQDILSNVIKEIQERKKREAKN